MADMRRQLRVAVQLFESAKSASEAAAAAALVSRIAGATVRAAGAEVAAGLERVERAEDEKMMELDRLKEMCVVVSVASSVVRVSCVRAMHTCVVCAAIV